MNNPFKFNSKILKTPFRAFIGIFWVGAFVLERIRGIDCQSGWILIGAGSIGLLTLVFFFLNPRVFKMCIDRNSSDEDVDNLVVSFFTYGIVFVIIILGLVIAKVNGVPIQGLAPDCRIVTNSVVSSPLNNDRSKAMNEKNSTNEGDEENLEFRCRRVISHLHKKLNEDMPNDAKPSALEQDMIDKALDQAVMVCVKEGLSVDQEKCILAENLTDYIEHLRTCPAIAKKKPSWLILPPSEAEIEEMMKNFQE